MLLLMIENVKNGIKKKMKLKFLVQFPQTLLESIPQAVL